MIRAYSNGGIPRISLQSATKHFSSSVQSDKLFFFDETAGSARMVIDSAGGVGIGTTTPDSLMHLSSNTNAQVRLEGTNAVAKLFLMNSIAIPPADTELGRVSFKGKDDAGNEIAYAAISSMVEDDTDGAESGNLRFTTTRDGAFPEAMRITSDGNVGIGTKSPIKNLHINDASGDEGNPGIFIQDPTATSAYGGSLTFDDRAGANFVKLSSFDNSVETGFIGLDRTTGNVGIGTTAPTARLDVTEGVDNNTDVSFRNNSQLQVSNTNATDGNLALIRTEVSGDGFHFGTLYNTNQDVDLVFRKELTSQSNDTELMRLTGDGKLGIGTGAPAQRLDVNGNIAVSGTTVHTSDRRLKKNIAPVENSLERVSQLEGVTYYWKDRDRDQHRQIGVIAQDIQEQFPEAVYENKETGFLSVNYSGLIGPLINAIKELFRMDKRQDREIASLKEVNAEMIKENEEMKKENQQMKNFLCEKYPSADFCMERNP